MCAVASALRGVSSMSAISPKIAGPARGFASASLPLLPADHSRDRPRLPEARSGYISVCTTSPSWKIFSIRARLLLGRRCGTPCPGGRPSGSANRGIFLSWAGSKLSLVVGTASRSAGRRPPFRRYTPRAIARRYRGEGRQVVIIGSRSSRVPAAIAYYAARDESEALSLFTRHCSLAASSPSPTDVENYPGLPEVGDPRPER